MKILEGVLGGGGGIVGGLFGEFQEGFVGGCLGIIMSGGFFFLFFFTLLAWIFGVDIRGFIIGWGAFPIVALLCVSALMSPVIGIIWGAKTGAYSMIRHIGCFGLYIVAMAIAAIALSTTF